LLSQWAHEAQEESYGNVATKEVDITGHKASTPEWRCLGKLWIYVPNKPTTRVKRTGVNAGKKDNKVEEKASADEALDQERFNNARKALLEYWNNK